MTDAEPTKCPLCEGEAQTYQSDDDHRHRARTIECQRCREFRVTQDAERELSARHQEFAPSLHVLSALTRDHWEAQGTALFLTTKELYSARDRRGLTVQDKLLRLLRKLAERSKFPGDSVRIHLKLDYPLAFCRNDDEMWYHVRCLKDAGYIEVLSTSAGHDCTVTPAGWAKIEEAPPDLLSRTKVFAAMWFSENTEAAYTEGIEPAILATGYDPVRVDRVEHVDRIDDRIMAEIRESRFVVADFTGHRGGVYFEAGFALGLGIRVIWSCRKDDLDHLHFDTSHFNYVVWQTPAELRERLETRIRAVIGLGQNAVRAGASSLPTGGPPTADPV